MEPVPNDASVLLYSVDEADRLVSVGGAFAAFADANGAPDLAVRCLGRSLYAFLSDPEVVAFNQDLMRRIRASGAVRDLPFRCDAPGVRRHMLLSATARADGGVDFETRLVRAEVRPPPARTVPEASGPRRLVRRCAWCNRIDAGGWVELEEAAVRLRLLEDVEGLRFTHGICPDCLANLLPQGDLDRAQAR